MGALKSAKYAVMAQIRLLLFADYLFMRALENGNRKLDCVCRACSKYINSSIYRLPLECNFSSHQIRIRDCKRDLNKDGRLPHSI
jgi:hypothetical protein